MNKLALQWLPKAGEELDPMAAYALQLAVWAIRMGHFQAGKPPSANHPLQEDVEEEAEMLAAATGRINAARAMEYLLSNPNLHPEEARANLLREFQRAQSPEEAGQKVATTLYDLMIARHP